MPMIWDMFSENQISADGDNGREETGGHVFILHCMSIMKTRPLCFFSVKNLDTKSKHKEPQDGGALCLSGGGYRAMLFHLGALWTLNELENNN